jgi:hypothetical protein
MVTGWPHQGESIAAFSCGDGIEQTQKPAHRKQPGAKGIPARNRVAIQRVSIRL